MLVFLLPTTACYLHSNVTKQILRQCWLSNLWAERGWQLLTAESSWSQLCVLKFYLRSKCQACYTCISVWGGDFLLLEFLQNVDACALVALTSITPVGKWRLSEAPIKSCDTFPFKFHCFLAKLDLYRHNLGRRQLNNIPYHARFFFMFIFGIGWQSSTYTQALDELLSASLHSVFELWGS